MEFFLPYRFFVSGTMERRPLTDHDLARAHGLGGDWLLRWKKEKATTFSAVTNFGASGVVPLIGLIALDWSATLIVLAIVIDIVAIWFTDVLKCRLAADDVEYQLDLSEDADRIYHVASAAISRSVRHVDNDIADNRIDLDSARAERIVVDYSSTSPSINSCLLGETLFCFMVVLVIVPWIFIFPASSAVIASATWESWTLLWSSAAIRIVITLVTLALSRSGRATVSLFPGSYLPAMFALITTVISAILIVNLPLEWAKANSGPIILVIYAIINLLAAHFIRRSMRHREKVIMEFLRTGPRSGKANMSASAAAIS